MRRSYCLLVAERERRGLISKSPCDSAAEKVFGCTVNQQGYKVIKDCGVIQGDGVSFETLGRVLDGVLAAGYSAQNCAFGMGGGLLQKLNRDTMSFATKLAHIVYEDGTERYV